MKGKKADWSLEDYLGRKQGLIVAGCDEVGRGAFAFSLVVAGCAYAPGVEMPYEIRDSKALTAEERERLVDVLTLEFVSQGQLHLAYAEASAAEVESSNLNELNLRLFQVYGREHLHQTDREYPYPFSFLFVQVMPDIILLKLLQVRGLSHTNLLLMMFLFLL